MKINCVVIDDEPFARKGLEKYINQIDFLEWQGSFGEVLQFQERMVALSPDLVFLDINMPEVTGIDFLKTLEDNRTFQVIFTTAYSEYAMDGYHLEVLDYLLKPISFERFYKAVNRAKSFFQHQKEPDVSDFVFVKSSHRYEKIWFDQILYVESLQNYISVIQKNGDKYLVHMPLFKFHQLLPQREFVQTHKSFVVAISEVTAIEGNQLVVGGQKIPIGRAYKANALASIGFNR